MSLATGRALVDAHKILSRLGLAEKMHYADFGSGALGHMVLPAGQIVGEEGRVYAVDILPNSLQILENRLRHVGLRNVETIWGDIEIKQGVNIPENTLDAVSLVNMIELIDRSPELLIEVERLLNPQGKVVVVDWHPDAISFRCGEECRKTPHETVLILQGLGFKVESHFRAGPHHWGVVAKPKN